MTGTPADPSDGVRIGTGTAEIRIIPEDDTADGRALRQADGAVVYRGNDRDVATVVAPTETGVQIATVSANPGASETFGYKLDIPDGARLAPDDDGGVSVVAADGAPLATIDPPWAQDAAGTELSTSYAIRGNTIELAVDKRGAELPVVADPKVETHWRWGGAAKFWFTRSETERMWRKREAGVPVIAVVLGLCAPLPGPFAYFCGVLVLAKAADFNINLRQAHQRKHCLTLFVGIAPRRKLDFDDGDGSRCVH